MASFSLTLWKGQKFYLTSKEEKKKNMGRMLLSMQEETEEPAVSIKVHS